jgi:hypothetical protein
MSRARAYSLKRLYGITPEQYDEMLRDQNYCCAVCGRHESEFKTKLAVDHDHVTLDLRGCLCTFCNSRVIGRHRDPELFRRAYEYLIAPRRGWLAPKRKPRKRKKRT